MKNTNSFSIMAGFQRTFPYAAEKTMNIMNGEIFSQNPLIYDGYEGELRISCVG